MKIQYGARQMLCVSAASLLLVGTAVAEAMPELAKKHECQSCHDMDKRLIGPSLREVAKRYRGVTKFTFEGKEYPLETGLMMKVSKGGAGNWGAMPMPGSDVKGTQQGEISELVRFVLSLAK